MKKTIFSLLVLTFFYLSSYSQDVELSLVTPEPGQSFFPGTDVTIEFEILNFVVGDNSMGADDGYILFTLNSETPQELFTTNPIILSGLSLGMHIVKLQLVDNNGSTLDPDVFSEFLFFVEQPATVSISDIQIPDNINTSDASPLYHDMIEVSGIVTGVHEVQRNNRTVQNYFIQDGAGEWNGVYVYNDSYNPEVGDEVTLIATVKEYYSCTQLKDVVSFNVNSQNNVLPNPATINTTQANTENYEGVLIKIENAVCTDVNAGNGMWEITNTGEESYLVSSDYFSFTPTLNATYTITGLGQYSYGNFKLLPRDENDIMETVSVENNNYAGITLYPNPVISTLLISGIGVENVKIFNFVGKEVFNSSISGSSIQINTQEFASGTYFSEISTKSGRTVVRKFIID